MPADFNLSSTEPAAGIFDNGICFTEKVIQRFAFSVTVFKLLSLCQKLFFGKLLILNLKLIDFPDKRHELFDISGRFAPKDFFDYRSDHRLCILLSPGGCPDSEFLSQKRRIQRSVFAEKKVKFFLRLPEDCFSFPEIFCGKMVRLGKKQHLRLSCVTRSPEISGMYREKTVQSTDGSRPFYRPFSRSASY